MSCDKTISTWSWLIGNRKIHPIKHFLLYQSLLIKTGLKSTKNSNFPEFSNKSSKTFAFIFLTKSDFWFNPNWTVCRWRKETYPKGNRGSLSGKRYCCIYAFINRSTCRYEEALYTPRVDFQMQHVELMVFKKAGIHFRSAKILCFKLFSSNAIIVLVFKSFFLCVCSFWITIP